MIVLTTPVFMTDEDAKKFLLFQRYYDIFVELEKNKAFDVEFGKVTLNIHSRHIQNIVVERMILMR